MASKKAIEYLRSCGIVDIHTTREVTNFSTGRGAGRFSMPYHIVMMRWDRSGDSKTTVNWADTLDSARAKLADARKPTTDGTIKSGADYLRQDRVAYYIRDIRTDKIYR